MHRSRRLLIICPYPVGCVPSQRFRWEQYLDTFRRAGFDVSIEPFYDQSTYELLYKRGGASQKAFGVISGILSRLRLLAKLRAFDAVFIHREAAPLGPPIFEALMFRLASRIVYDF